MLRTSIQPFKLYFANALYKLKFLTFLLGILIVLFLLVHTRILRISLGNPDVLVKNTEPIIVKFPFGSSDAFGRLRTSTPLTLFDSSFRYADTDLWVTSTSGTASATFSNGSMVYTLNGASGAKVYRETTAIFSYQPGKSLLILSTMAFAPLVSGLRQRVGYFGSQNGIYLEADGLELYFVLKSESLGTTERVPSHQWVSQRSSFDITKGQIFWIDIEWLGVGDVRCGFIEDGEYVLKHTFHNDNVNIVPYMTTASLPLRIEVENTAATGVTSTFRHICNSVISEGGYTLYGSQKAVGTYVTSARTSSGTAGTFIPIVALQLVSTRLDALAILSGLSIIGLGNNILWRYEIRANCTVTGGSWTADGSVEYNLTGTDVSGGRVLLTGYFYSNTQSSPTIVFTKDDLFKFQLERNSFTGVSYTMALCVAASGTSQSCYGSLDWEEVTR